MTREVPEQQCAATSEQQCTNIVKQVPEQVCETVTEEVCSDEAQCTTAGTVGLFLPSFFLGGGTLPYLGLNPIDHRPVKCEHLNAYKNQE